MSEDTFYHQINDMMRMLTAKEAVRSAPNVQELYGRLMDFNELMTELYEVEENI